MNFAAREVLVFLIWVPLALPVGVAYMHFLTHVLGRTLGLEWVGAVMAVPAAIIVFAVAIWLPVWGSWRQKRRARLGLLAPLAAALLIAGATFVICSLNCFAAGGPQPFLAYFVMVPAMAAAYLHDRFSHAWLPAPEEAT